MDKRQTFAQGFIEGWHSIVGPRFVFPEIPSPSIHGSGSEYMSGLLQGIEAAKKAKENDRETRDQLTGVH